MTRPAPARKRANVTTTVEDMKEKRFGNRNLTQVSDFPSIYTKRGCGAERLLELGVRRRDHFNLLLSPVCASLSLRHPERKLLESKDLREAMLLLFLAVIPSEPKSPLFPLAAFAL